MPGRKINNFTKWIVNIIKYCTLIILSMEYLIQLLRDNPAVPLFLTLGVGFWWGNLKFKGFSLGPVTSVLLIGVLVGQLNIPLSGQIKSVFFMMFLFSIGYSVGPRFFASLRGEGLKEVLFAVLMSSMCMVVVVGLAWLMGYTPGEAVGLFGGSQTCSSLIGVGGDAVSRLPMSEAAKQQNISIIPVCYAVTYIFGTLGTVIILGNFGPKLLGGVDKVKKMTAELEAEEQGNDWENDPANVNAMRFVSFRAYIAEHDQFNGGLSVLETEELLREAGIYVFIERVRSHGKIKTAKPSTIIYKDDTVVLTGRREFMTADITHVIGQEVADAELLTFPVEKVPVRISKRKTGTKKLRNILGRNFMHGVVIRDISRNGKDLALTLDTIIKPGDQVTLMGRREKLHKAAHALGHMDRPTFTTDFAFLGMAIFIGGLFGALTFVIDGMPVSFGTSGGALVGGLIFGWLRSKRPTFGAIPTSALKFMNTIGLNAFIAVVGIDAGPSFVSGLVQMGPMLFVIGALATTIPLLFGLWLGHKVFKFHPAITLGCCAGTRTCTAALGAVQDALNSTIPAMGYTVTYAVSNVLLVIWGTVSVMILF